MLFVSVTPVYAWRLKIQYAQWPPGLNRDPVIGAQLDEKACLSGGFGVFECEKGTQETFTNDQLDVSSLIGFLTLLDYSGAANGR